MEAMQSLCRELNAYITTAATGTGEINNHLLMISHDDLDGIGCTALVGHIINQVSTVPTWCAAPVVKMPGLLRVRTTNTGKFVPNLYDVIAEKLQEVSGMLEHRKVTVLITDLGNITFQGLYDRFRDWNHGNITFIVVDHHKHPYQDADEVPMTEEPYKDLRMRRYCLTHDKDADSTLAFFEDGPLFRCFAWLGYKGYSATRMLAELFIAGEIQKLEPTTLAWADLVSKYDTGHWGNWFIPETRRMDQHYYATEVAPEVKMFQTWNMFNIIPGHTKASHLDNLIANYIRHLDAKNDFTVDPKEPDLVQTILAKQSREYTTFMDRVGLSKMNKIATNTPGGYHTASPADLPIAFKLPMDLDICPNIQFFVNSEATTTWPLSIFAKKYLEESDTVKLLMAFTVGNDHKTVRVELRSASDDVNCYEIAKLNGGGGHPRAAGFYTKLLK